MVGAESGVFILGLRTSIASPQSKLGVEVEWVTARAGGKAATGHMRFSQPSPGSQRWHDATGEVGLALPRPRTTMSPKVVERVNA